MVDNTFIRDGATLERVATGAIWGEGPLWIPKLGVLRWSDIPGNRILQWDRDTGLQVHAVDAEFPNGRALRGTEVVQCSHGRRAIEIERDGEVEVLVDHFGDARLNSPNDIAVHPDGSIWFTDPPYGIVQPHEGHLGEQEYGGCFVFRFANGTLTPVITDVLRPNGIAFSPDGQTVYVTDTSVALGDGPDHCIRAYRIVDEDGVVQCVDGAVLAEVAPGAPDGIAVDIEGRIWSSSANGVHILSDQGTPLGHIPVPEVVGNLCFGEDGGTLFIAAATSLYRIETTTRGAL